MKFIPVSDLPAIMTLAYIWIHPNAMVIDVVKFGLNEIKFIDSDYNHHSASLNRLSCISQISQIAQFASPRAITSFRSPSNCSNVLSAHEKSSSSFPEGEAAWAWRAVGLPKQPSNRPPVRALTVLWMGGKIGRIGESGATALPPVAMVSVLFYY